MMLFLHRLVITLQQVHSHFHSKFCTVCELVLLPANSSTSCFLKVDQRLLTSSSFPPILLPYRQYNVSEGSSCAVCDHPITLPSINSTQYIPLSLNSLQHFSNSHMIGPTDLLNPSTAPHIQTFKLLLIQFPNCPHFNTIPSCVPQYR